MIKNTRVTLAKRPVGEPTDDCFRIEESDIPELGDNQILIKVCWLSLDPYMRGRMNDMKSYVEPLQIGDVMTGESSGIVVQSNSPAFAVGDPVAAHDDLDGSRNDIGGEIMIGQKGRWIG